MKAVWPLAMTKAELTERPDGMCGGCCYHRQATAALSLSVLCRNTTTYCFFVASACPRSTISPSISFLACVAQHNTQHDKLQPKCSSPPTVPPVNTPTMPSSPTVLPSILPYHVRIRSADHAPTRREAAVHIEPQVHHSSVLKRSSHTFPRQLRTSPRPCIPNPWKPPMRQTQTSSATLLKL